MKINIKEEKCLGCGLCINIAPGTFEHDENGKAKVKDVVSDTPADIKTAAQMCSQSAIEIEE
ncbi:MAG: ferredoxin [bacterium]